MKHKITFKNTKTTYGRNGEGFITNLYVDGQKLLMMADYADGSIVLDIQVNKDFPNAYKVKDKLIALAKKLSKEEHGDLSYFLFRDDDLKHAQSLLKQHIGYGVIMHKEIDNEYDTKFKIFSCQLLAVSELKKVIEDFQEKYPKAIDINVFLTKSDIDKCRLYEVDFE